MKVIKEHLEREIAEFRANQKQGNHHKCFEHLSRAHILSQKSWHVHLYVHGIMFMYAWKRRDLPEIFGQALRLLVTSPGHLLGRVPQGNIGWSTVGLTQEMPVQEDLKKILES